MFNTNNNHCCNGTLTCTGNSCTCDGIDCQSTIGAGIVCYENSVRCADGCGSFDGKNCYGVCYDADCPSGLKRKILDIHGVCYREGSDISCYKKNPYNTYVCYKGTTICSRSCTGFEATGCTTACQESFTCPNNGALVETGNGNSACSYTGGLKCNILNGSCSLNDFACGTGCHVDGSGCTTGVCLQSECPDGQLLTYNGSAYVCIAPQVSCSGTTCSIAGRQCGTGCQNDGTSCSAGICNQNDCLLGTQLRQATNEYYGCYNPNTGTTCYKYGNLAVCYKNGTMCGSDCDLDGENCSQGQTCVPED